VPFKTQFQAKKFRVMESEGSLPKGTSHQWAHETPGGIGSLPEHVHERRPAMARLTTKQRNALPSQSFALPGRRFPIADKSHARNALARVSQFGSPSEKAAVRSKVASRFPGIGQGKKKGRKGPTNIRKAAALRIAYGK
jgi:hypothetical protein